MEFDYQKEDKLLTITLTDEIDHHTADKIRRRADYEIQRYMPKKAIFDFTYVNFMDSAGIGLLIGRYKMVSMLRRNIRNKECKSKCKKNFRNVRCFKNYTFNRSRRSEIRSRNEKYVIRNVKEGKNEKCM